MEITITKTRSGLLEGRRTGMAVGILRKTGEDTYETVSPMSPCKDYLAEVIFTEHTGIPSSAYGFSHKEKLGIFENEENVYLGITFVDLPDVREEFVNHIPETVQCMNAFEEHFGIKGRTSIQFYKDNIWLVVAPIEWAASTHSISLYTLLLRNAPKYTGEDLNDFIAKQGYGYDKSYLTAASTKAVVARKKLPANSFSLPVSDGKLKGSSPHNFGIVAFNEKTEGAPWTK